MNHKLTKGVACIAYWSGLDALFYRLNRKAKHVITFHNILPDEVFLRNVANGVSNSASEFRFIVRELKKRWRFSTDLEDASTITLTFDDGYLNQYEVAAEILREEGDIPAILFSSGDVADGKMLMVDRLLHWAALVPKHVILRLGCTDAFELWVGKLWPEFVADVEFRGQKVYDRLNATYPFEKIFASMNPEYRRLRLSGIDAMRMDDLRSRGWKIGYHTKSHYPLALLADEAKIAEMTPPAEMRDVVFSYPYGEEQSVGKRSLAIAESLGYPAAVSNTTDPTVMQGLYFKPRMALAPNRCLLHLELSGLKHFLKFGKLLDRAK